MCQNSTKLELSTKEQIKKLNKKEKKNEVTYSLGSWGWPDIVQIPVLLESDSLPAPLDQRGTHMCLIDYLPNS